jgi:hypothetical protein
MAIKAIIPMGIIILDIHRPIKGNMAIMGEEVGAVVPIPLATISQGINHSPVFYSSQFN